MSDIRDKFTANAEEFDSLMMEMLNYNSQLKKNLKSAARQIADRIPSEIVPDEVTWPAILSAVSRLKQQRNNADVENEALTAQVAELKEFIQRFRDNVCVGGVVGDASVWVPDEATFMEYGTEATRLLGKSSEEKH